MFAGQGQAVAVAVGQLVGLAIATAPPDRADCVDHPLCRQIVAARDAGLARGAAAEGAAFLQQSKARGAVYRPIYAATAQEQGIRRVDDGVCLNVAMFPSTISIL